MDTITRREARDVEAGLFADKYGLDADAARQLVDDARKHGGIDALARNLARDAGEDRLWRTTDPDEDQED